MHGVRQYQTFIILKFIQDGRRSILLDWNLSLKLYVLLFFKLYTSSDTITFYDLFSH